MKKIMPINTDLNLGVNYNPQGPLSNLGREMGDAARIGFNDSPPVVSSVDQDKQKYYSTLVQAGVDPSMARQIAGFAAPVKEYVDMAQGKKPFAQGDSWNISGTPFGPNPNISGIWDF
jgi:hypothetical protein